MGVSVQSGNLLKNVLLVNYLLYNYHVKALSLIDPIKVIESNGYPGEAHETTTEDGYILKLFRIPRGLSKSAKNCTPVPIILTHGVCGNTGYFMDFKPNQSLAFILADEGYDVWLLNNRGNGYSTKHVTFDLDRDPQQFYNFSIHEIGYYDLPAAIDYVLDVTKQKSVHYLGHSQGGTIFYIMGSTRPEYNQKITLATIFAGTGIMKNPPDMTLRILAYNVPFLKNLASWLQLYHTPLLDTVRGLMYNLCSRPSMENFCIQLINLIGGFEDEAQFEKERVKVIFTHTPSDCSFMQYYHYGQLINTGQFRQYDYGPKGNRIKYGSDTPPEYDFSKITAPANVYCAKNDRFLSVTDCETMINLLPNIAHKRVIPYKKFNHMDYVYAKDVKKMLYNEVLKVMAAHNNC